MKHKSFRLSPRSRQELRSLAELYGENETQIIRRLVGERHEREANALALLANQKAVEAKQQEELSKIDLEYFETGVSEAARLLYEDGETFTTDDWQGPQPHSKAEIADFNWIHEKTGAPAVMINGLPRILG